MFFFLLFSFWSIFIDPLVAEEFVPFDLSEVAMDENHHSDLMQPPLVFLREQNAECSAS